MTTSLPEALSHAVATGLDLLPNPFLVLDNHARILHANHAAKEAAQNGRSVIIRDGVLLIASMRHADVLQKMLSRPASAPAHVCINIPHPPGKPCTVVVLPVANHDVDGKPAALVFIGDPELRREPDAEVLSQLYGFTVAQARVAALLMQGRNVEEVASTLGITEHTARNHLKRLFLKTKTKKQVELLQTLMASPACLRLPVHTNGHLAG